MIIAINQPYYFPYIGYFSLIKHTDQFILLDVVQFKKQSWMRRNRILKNGESWDYFSVPVVKSSLGTSINEIEINNNNNWGKENLAKLEYYKQKAPYYPEVRQLLEDFFSHKYHDVLSLNKASLELICNYLEIEADIKVLSEMDLQFEKPGEPDEWALNICKAIGNVQEYWNPPAGKEFYDTGKYEDEGLTIRFLQNNMKPYDQQRETFEPGLSIIDVMMFNDKNRIHELIDDFKFI